jgi:hypothetical protein
MKAKFVDYKGNQKPFLAPFTPEFHLESKLLMGIANARKNA